MARRNIDTRSGVVDCYKVKIGDASGPTERPEIQSGSGAPTHAAPKGSLYIRIDAAGTITRLYVNTNSSTTWATFTTSA